MVDDNGDKNKGRNKGPMEASPYEHAALCCPFYFGFFRSSDRRRANPATTKPAMALMCVGKAHCVLGSYALLVVCLSVYSIGEGLAHWGCRAKSVLHYS